MSATRAVEARAECNPANENAANNANDNERTVTDNLKNQENLYMEVLNTIANTVGAPTSGGQVMLQYFIYYVDGKHKEQKIYYLS